MGAFAGEDVDFLALISPANRKRLLQHSERAAYPAGSVPFRAHEGGRALVLESGLVRTFWTVPDGREATIAFIYPGNLLGGRNLVPGTATMLGPSLVSVQVVVDSSMRVLDLDTVRELAANEIEVVTAIATMLAARVRYDLRLIAVRSLGNIAERLAFDLLERASRFQLTAGKLEAQATHEGLAASIGSSREVVSRALRQLRDAGIVETAPGRTLILDPVRLAEIVRTFVI
jgi:CRP/FNR family transcriptional regulator, cyclic AMP receptor protein